MLIINKHFNFCCFRALAYTTLDRLCAVFLYNNRYHHIPFLIVVTMVDFKVADDDELMKCGSGKRLSL